MDLIICNLLQVQYGFDSCIMGKIAYIIPRLVIGYVKQGYVYSTSKLCLPLTERNKTEKEKEKACLSIVLPKSYGMIC